MTQPVAFLFGMDGLLLDTERAFLDAALTVLVPRGYDPASVRAFFVSLVGSSAADTRQDLLQHFGDDADAFEAEWYTQHQSNMARYLPSAASEALSFITRVCGSVFRILGRQLGQARRARSPQIAQAAGALLRAFDC